jgi:probable rRNA maturation factor
MTREESAKKIIRHIPKRVRAYLPQKIKVIAVSRKKSEQLNRRYRWKRKAANVLSFRYGPEYGEIIICPEVIRRDAKKAGRPYRLEAKLMIAHGLLHLAGLHHEKSKTKQKRFEQLEQRILKKVERRKTRD